MQLLVSSSAGEPVLHGRAGGQTVALNADPNFVEKTTPFGKQRIGLLGVEASKDPAAVKRVSYSALGRPEGRGGGTWNLVDRTLNFLRRLVLGWESADQLSGPIGIARASGTAFDLGGVYSLVSLIGFMSVSIGLINLFPIPLLDGGHLLFYAIEAVRGRPLSDKAQEIGFRIGFAIVAMLMLFATWNDLVHLGTSFMARGT